MLYYLKLFVLSLILMSISVAQEPLKIGVEGAYPPFSYVTPNGEVEGFEPALAHLLCAKMQQECVLIQTDFDALIPALNAKKIDVILASMSVTQERQKVIDFSSSYYQSPARFITLTTQAETLKEPDHFNGKIIGVQSGTIHEIYIQDNFSKMAQVQSYQSLDEAMNDLMSGRVDVVFADRIALESGYLQKTTTQNLPFVLLPGDYHDAQWFGSGIGAGIRKGDHVLKQAINDAISKAYEDGSYQALAKKYFTFDISVHPHTEN